MAVIKDKQAERLARVERLVSKLTAEVREQRRAMSERQVAATLAARKRKNGTKPRKRRKSA
jgi:hypothetical protein